MEEAKMFHLLWEKFVNTGVLRENRDETHKVLYQTREGNWALKYVQGATILIKPTLEELMLESVLAHCAVVAALRSAKVADIDKEE